MAYYYNDPSGLGSWYVPDGSTPVQALQSEVLDTGATVSPILQLSVENTPAAQTLNGGNPSKNTVASPPKPTGYTNQGASLIPVRVALTPWQQSNAIAPIRSTANIEATGAGSNQDCPDGYYYDAFNDQCVPIDQGPPVPFPIGGPPGTVQDTGTVVVVNNAVNLASGVGQAISDAIAQGIQGAVDQAKAAAADAAQAVEAGIQDTIDAVSNAANSLIQGLKDALSYVANLIQQNIGQLIGFITDNIGKVIGAVNNALTTISNVVQNVIAPILQKISDVINNTIAPIFQAIQQTYQQTAALITAIEKDVNNGIQGILQLPTDLANGFSQIGADIDAALNKIYINRNGQVAVGFDFPDSSPILSNLKGIGPNLAAPQGPTKLQTTFGDKVNLSNPSLTQIGADALEVLHKLGLEALAMEGKYHDDVNATLRSSYADVGGILGSLATLGVDWFLIAATVAASLLPLYRAVENQANSNIPLTKLSPDQAVQAYVRTLISKEQAQAEMQFAGLDVTRQQALLDLSKWLAPLNDALEWWFRGIITDEDLVANLTQHAIIPDDQAAIKEAGYKRIGVEVARTALRWGILDNTAFDAVLKQNRYTDNEIALEHATLYQHESVNEVISRERLQILFSGLGYTPEGFATPSQDTLDAANRDGQDAKVALDQWQASFFVLPLQEWITGYFRNLFDTRQLAAAMDYYRIPSQWRGVLVNNRRPLIPWRTIPTMVANGILDSSTASNILQQHGFDLPSTETLLKYAALAKPKTTSAAAGELFGLSVGTARAYFEQGTLTADQYHQVLMAHGYNVDSANLAVKVEQAKIAQLQRKQQADDIVAEVLVGTLSLSQAQQMMEANQFTDAEKSKIFNAVNRSKRQANKLPSEAELHDMASKGAISVDLYRSTMSQLGWSDSWIQNFVNWRFPSATPATATS